MRCCCAGSAFRYAATSWKVERRVIARVEAGPQGADSRFIVTNLAGLPKALYEKVYFASEGEDSMRETIFRPRRRPSLHVIIRCISPPGVRRRPQGER